MFSSRGLCSTLRTGVFESVLQVNGSLEVNSIVSGSAAPVSIEGYPVVDDLVVVDFNLSEAVDALSVVNFAFVADRDYELVSASKIYHVQGGVGAGVTINKLVDNVTIIPFDLSVALDVDDPETINYPALENLAKGNALRLTTSGTMTGLEGCVITIVLRQK